jgi:cytoskeletal protein RodZ
MAQPQPQASGGVLTQRLGPLATWVWLLIATVGIGIYYLIAKARSKNSGNGSGQAGTGEAAGVQDVPDIVLQNYTSQTASPTVNVPPTTPTAPTTPAAPSTPTKPTTPSKPAAKAPAKSKYDTVTVAKWTATNTPWDSTLSGIAAHYHVKGGYQALAKLNGIKNPNLIYPGQKIKVPVS